MDLRSKLKEQQKALDVALGEERNRCAELRQELDTTTSQTRRMKQQWEETVMDLRSKLKERQSPELRDAEEASRNTTALEVALGEERNRCAELRQELDTTTSQTRRMKQQWEDTVMDLRSKLKEQQDESERLPTSALHHTEEASRSNPRKMGVTISQTEQQREETLTSLRSELEAQQESSQLLKACAMRQAQEASHTRKALESALHEERSRSAEMIEQIQRLARTNEGLLERLDGDTFEEGDVEQRYGDAVEEGALDCFRGTDRDWEVISGLKVKLEDEIVKSGALRIRLHHSESLRMRQAQKDPDELSLALCEAVELAEGLLEQRTQLQTELASLRGTDQYSAETPFLRPASPIGGNCSSDSGLNSDCVFEGSDEAVEREIDALRKRLPATSPRPVRHCPRPRSLQHEGLELQQRLEEGTTAAASLAEAAISQVLTGSLELPPPDWQREPAYLDSD